MKNNSTDSFAGIYYIANIIIAFKAYGIGWGIVSFFVPIFPLIYLAQYLPIK